MNQLGLEANLEPKILVSFLWISAEIPLETSQIALDDDVALEG